MQDEYYHFVRPIPIKDHYSRLYLLYNAVHKTIFNKEVYMKRSSSWLSIPFVLIVFNFFVPLTVNAEKFPTLNELRQTNVALEIAGFGFASGLRLTNAGKPNGSGFEILPQKWVGSGFIVSTDGSVITNYHVARRALRCIAKFDDGSSFEVKHIRTYLPSEDLAIFKISGNRQFRKVRLGNSDDVNPLDHVLAVGNPQGRGLNVTKGDVSQVVRDDNNKPSVIVHTATITSGNSGGALYRGRYVMGVNTSVMIASYGGGTGFNNAVPINKAKYLLQRYGRQSLPLVSAFPPDAKTIIRSKFKQVDAANASVSAASGNRAGEYPFRFTFSGLEDYMIIIDSPGRDLAVTVFDQGGLIGFGDMRQAGIDGVIISNGHAKNVIIKVLNYDSQPANFGIHIGYINW